MAGEKVSIVTNWEVERVGSRAEVILSGAGEVFLCIYLSDTYLSGRRSIHRHP